MYSPDWMAVVRDRKTGEPVVAHPHPATFNGSHNSCKSKVLIVLYHRKHKLHQTTGLTLNELAQASGVSYAYLKSRLGKWVVWKYLVRKMTDGTNRPVYSYSIGKRGEHFIEDRIPRDRLQDYIAEIKAFKSKQGQTLL